MSSTSINPKSIQEFATPIRPPSARGRLIWKEFRQNTPVLIVFVAVLAMILGLTKSFVQSQPSHPSHGYAFWFPIIWTFTNIFALTIGVFIFAPERENRTDQLLSILPMGSGFAVWTKLCVGLAMIVAFALIGGLFQAIELFVIGSRFQDAFLHDSAMGPWAAGGLMVGTGVLLSLECFFWGAICSLYAKRAVVAAVLATGCFVLFSWMLPMICGMMANVVPSATPAVTGFLISKALIYLVMGFALVRLGSRWLGHTTSEAGESRRFRLRSRPIVSASSLVGDRPEIVDRTTSRIYSSLIWQSFRQYGSTLLIALAISVPLFLLGVASAASIDFGNSRTFVVVTFMIGLALLPMVGSMFVFSGDHQNRNYRFFQQHGEYGRKLWFARLLPAAMLSMVCACVLVFSICVLGLWGGPNNNSGNSASLTAYEFNLLYQFIVAAILFVFCGFAIGQFSSMFFRSGVFTFVCAILMGVLALAWVAGLIFLNVNLWFYFAPIPVALLTITWWRAPSWLADRDQILQLVLPWLALGTIAGCVFGAMVYHRISEIQETGKSLTQQTATLKYLEAGKKTEKLDRKGQPEFTLWNAADAIVGAEKFVAESVYSGDEFGLARFQSATSIKSMQPLDDFIQANQQALDLVHQVDRIPATRQILDPDYVKRGEQISQLELLISAEARKSELDGDLEQALEHWLRYKEFQDRQARQHYFYSSATFCLIRWAELPGQSPELIKQAMDALEFTQTTWTRRAENESFVSQLDFANWYDDLKQGTADSNSGAGIHFQHPEVLHTPWERERSRRIVQNVLSLIPERYLEFNYMATNPRESWRGRFFEMWVNPPDELPKEMFSLYGFGSWRDGNWQEAFRMFQQIQSRRYARVRMALAAWALDHGNYPNQLDQLVPTYLDELPVDVFYGGNFTYSPVGMNAKVGWTMQIRRNASSPETGYEIRRSEFDQLIPPNTPFLLPWTSYGNAAPLTCHVTDEVETEPFEVYDFSDPQNRLSHWMDELNQSYTLKTPTNQEQED